MNRCDLKCYHARVFDQPTASDCFTGRVGNDAGDHRHTPICSSYSGFYQLQVLIWAQGVAFTGTAPHRNAMYAIVDQPVNLQWNRSIIDLAVCIERGGGRNNHAG